MSRIRYFTPDDVERGILRSTLKRLGRAKQIAAMKMWFQRYYEDPANETPYESKEGGYQYIWGGPYEAKDELYTEFGDIVREDRIDELVVELERHCVEWAPTGEHPDHRNERGEEDSPNADPLAELDSIVSSLEGGATPKFGDGYELGLRQEILDRIASLENQLRALRPDIAGIGHNRPPLDSLADDSEGLFVEELLDSSRSISEELKNGSPNALNIGRASQRMKAVRGWLIEKSDKVVDSLIELAVPATLGAIGANLPAIIHGLATTLQLLVNWLSAITWPF